MNKVINPIPTETEETIINELITLRNNGLGEFTRTSISYISDKLHETVTSTTIEEDAKLIESGFQYVTERNGTKLY